VASVLALGMHSVGVTVGVGIGMVGLGGGYVGVIVHGSAVLP
jgi:hypothetical protein